MNSFYNHYYRYYTPYIPNPSYNNSNTNNNNNNSNNNTNNSNNNVNNNNSKKNNSSKYNSFGPINFKNPLFTDIEEPIFEIFGIELYLDDIIILGLLFFLYKEGVQDEMLFISLILLLLS